MTVEDETGDVQLIVWPRVFAKYKRELGKPCVVWQEGVVSRHDGTTNVTLSSREDTRCQALGCPPPTTGIEVTRSIGWDNLPEEKSNNVCGRYTLIADIGGLAQRFEFDGSRLQLRPRLQHRSHRERAHREEHRWSGVGVS